MTHLPWPVFANEHGDLTVLLDEWALRSTIEALDVENGEYVFHDAHGFVLAPSVDERGLVHLARLMPPRCEEGLLASELLAHLRLSDGGLDSCVPENESLQWLVSRVVARESAWLARRPQGIVDRLRGLFRRR